MLTKYYIEIDGVKTEVPKECLKNWDEIKCVYKRADFSGVTRSFTTQFEFVGEMYDRLLALYLRDGVNAKATISLYTITNEWQWEEQFSCELDFSSINWDAYTVKLNSIDNSLAALIKSQKSAKYEAVIDNDIESDRIFAFNRLPIENSITYEYTGGYTNDSDGSLTTDLPTNNRIYMGIVSDEDVSVNGIITWNDDQTEDVDSFMIRAHGDATVRLDVELASDRCYPVVNAPSSLEADDDLQIFYGTYFSISIYHSDNTKTTKSGLSFGSDNLRYCGNYDSANALRTEYTHDRIVVNGSIKHNYWALVNGIVWMVIYRGSAERTSWESTGQSETQFKRKIREFKVTLDLKAGDRVAVETTGTKAKLYSSKFSFSWFAKGKPISVSAFSPARVGQYILNKICAGKLNAILKISDFDVRLQKTIIVAAESIRCIPNSKIYSSFNDFCDWMETVFGYTYYLGKRVESKFVAHKNAYGGIMSTMFNISSEHWNAHNNNMPTEEDIIYFSCYGKFLASDGSRWYSDFPGVEDYNDASTGLARTDTVFTIKNSVNGEIKYHNYYFTTNTDGSLNSEPVEFVGNIEDFTKPFQPVVFLHRSELFNSRSTVHQLTNAREIEYSIDSGQLYSTVNIGYDKKDYQNINGRDEFNFNNTYSTGCSVVDKKLTLKSKYRGDCYGVEFTAQKRGEDTTDTTSDNDVFFVFCKISERGSYIPDTTATIENAISDEVFNGVFSPMACIEANAGFIGMQGNPLPLEFTSSEGNSNIIINGIPMNSDIVVSEPLITCGVLEFSSSDVDTELDVNALYEVKSNGITYRGFIKEVSFKYAKAETVKYKLIVKEVEL